jgi:uncharacterized protein
MADYKTPGVYVEEISTLPPSVGQVPTAIPAFIGYTQIALKNKKDLTFAPTHITSLLDYHALFGYGATPGKITVTLNEKNGVKGVAFETQRYLYDSVRLFYANGGGECYIVSVGDYTASPSLEALQGGLDALYAEDHPTMLVCPDAMLLEKSGDCYALQQAMLKQCAEMQNRFAIFDVHQGFRAKADQDVVLDFRNGIGINHLNYGAAYYPWIQTVYTPSFGFGDLNLLDANKSKVNLIDLIDNPAPVTTLNQVMQDEKNILAAAKGYFASAINVADFDALPTELAQKEKDAKAEKDEADATKKAALVEANKAAKGQRLADWLDSKMVSVNQQYAGFPVAMRDQVGELLHYLNTIKTLVLWPFKLSDGTLKANPGDAAAFKLESEDMKRQIKSKIGMGTPLSSHIRSLEALNLALGQPSLASEAQLASLLGGVTAAPNIATVTTPVTGNTPAVLADLNMATARNKFKAVLDAVVGVLDSVKADAAKIRGSHDKNLYDNEVLYKSIVNEIQTAGGLLPPSGGIAGLYAQVDNQIGVWKAPANVSLASTNRPAIKIDDKEQQDLNVDVNAGKSVNAIRSFQGKGTLVWGARTLAGNDNEWRYVSVRRTFIMVEQSVKASTFWAVFEANESRTWVKVKAMITNYLNNLWRQGALAGSTPEAAYFVNLGLGQTMTAVDILEGRMNVEIGLAVVRPAEFIILKFSHKMQEA